MRKKLLAVVILSCVLSGSAYGASWSDYWGSVSDYASEKWSNAADYFGGWFSSGSADTPAPVSGDSLPGHIASGWDRLTGTLGSALTLRDKQESLPRRSWIPFMEDRVSNAKKINELLDEALSILVQGEAAEIRKTATELRAKLTQQRTELDELRNKRITAPESSNLPWRLTKAKADEKIASLQEEIADGEQRLNEINAKLAASLKSIGLELDESQIEVLLNLVTADDIMQNTIIFANVKAVVAKLEELSQNDTNTLDITRRYTGLYLVLNDLLIHTQEELVRKIDGDYKAKLKAIISEADALRKEALTRSNQDMYTPEQRKAFAANAESNEMTIQVAKLYIELLDSQRAGTMESLKSLRLNRDLAENTYKTVRSSGELRGLIHSGLELFDAVGTLKMPELKIFESGAMRAEFEEINRRLKKE